MVSFSETFQYKYKAGRNRRKQKQMGITKALLEYIGKTDSRLNTGHVLLGAVDKKKLRRF